MNVRRRLDRLEQERDRLERAVVAMLSTGTLVALANGDELTPAQTAELRRALAEVGYYCQARGYN